MNAVSLKMQNALLAAFLTPSIYIAPTLFSRNGTFYPNGPIPLPFGNTHCSEAFSLKHYQRISERQIEKLSRHVDG